MRNEFTAIIEREGDWLIAYSPEIPGANGQGQTGVGSAATTRVDRQEANRIEPHALATRLGRLRL